MPRQPKHEPHGWVNTPQYGIIFQDGKVLLLVDENGDIVLRSKDAELGRITGGVAVWPTDLSKTSSDPDAEAHQNKQTINVYLNTKDGPRVVSVTGDMERKKLVLSWDCHLTEKGWRPISAIANSSSLLAPDLMWNLLNLVEQSEGNFPRLVRLEAPQSSTESDGTTEK